MPNFSYGDSCQTGDDKYVIAQFRSDASLGWVGELRAFLVKDELKYKWFHPERHRVRSRPELWKRVETGVHQAEITIIDPHVYRDFAIGEFLEQQAIPGIDFDLRTINELSGRYIIDDSPLGSVEVFDKDWPFDRTLMKDKGTFTSASLRQRAGGKLKDAVIVAARSHAMISPSELTELIGSCRRPEGQLARWKRISNMNWTFDVEHPKSLPILNEFSERLAHAAGLPRLMGRILHNGGIVSEAKSHEIDHIQAADLAAGWAVDLLTLTDGDYRSLAQRFAWVGVNGVIVPA